LYRYFKDQGFRLKISTGSGWTGLSKKREFYLTAGKILQMCRPKELILPFGLFLRLKKQFLGRQL
jgi:hypothetical protein